MAEDVGPAGNGHTSPAVLAVTPAARSVVLDARAQEADAERLALWVEVTGSRDGAYTYDIYFQVVADAAETDAVGGDDDLRGGRPPSRAWPVWPAPASTGPTKARAGSSS
jgi:hypothetical protein